MHKRRDWFRLSITLVFAAEISLFPIACAKNPYETPAPASITVDELADNTRQYHGNVVFLTGVLFEGPPGTYFLKGTATDPSDARPNVVRLEFESQVDSKQIARCMNEVSYALGALKSLEPAIFKVTYLQRESDLKTLSPYECA